MSFQLPAEFKSQPTPFYYYDLALLDQTLAALTAAARPGNFQVHYALKANSNLPILQRIQQAGLGADCVSGGEVQRALEAGFAPNHVVFAGVGKSDAEINRALAADIFCFNAESVPELQVLNELAAAQGRTARVALRINPNVDAHTHAYITTGLEANKFGISLSDLAGVVDGLDSLPNVELIGLHAHIGSQITELHVFANLSRKLNELQTWLEDRGHQLPHLNVGGGLGIDYQHPDTNPIPDFGAYFGMFEQHLVRRPSQQVHVELGRAVVAQAGTLVSRVLYVKESQQTRFAILDAGMTELIRPALYGSHHHIENISSQLPALAYDVVGPICESSDTFAKAVQLAETRRGDLVAIRSAGAYGEVMSSSYNLREKAEALYR
ncbi:diaminopimelate decarboxylase [Hymenobacter taeanensis]|uniref:Diaminopimelate decarboxylase n=1 Tax=Hymenobacter taeanensis TaxID=2735321 RepID=A0A6M6BKQ5_9BACT|nr:MULTISPECIES: diaminopimelate decarboxylase [Hymenobacter]QJX48013.1 diaminopimelate decarboxylase [Hymenobacter taeanensis]UOQ82537.1 diaminopimelate decarboxylase [Hymenobacter sp. 5414T-23]